MGTTRIKVIDLSSDQKEIKTARKHAEKIAWKKDGKETKKPQEEQVKAEPKEETESEIKAEAEEKTAPEPAKKPQKSKVAGEKTVRHHQGTKYLNAASKIEKGKIYNAEEALELLYQTSYVKFDPSVELHLSVIDKSVRGSVALPHMVGKKKEKIYLVFSEKKPFDNAQGKEEIPGKKIIWGDEKTIGQIESGSLKPKRNFDTIIATPKFMPHLAKVAKILGPAGVMPNPKNKTVTEDIKEALGSEKEDLHEYRTEPNAPVIHTTLGKLSQKKEEISENAKVLITSIGPSKIKQATLTSTMGPAIRFDPASFISR